MVESLETVFDACGGDYHIVSIKGDEDEESFKIETWQLEWYNLSNMPHQIEARRQIAKILREL